MLLSPSFIPSVVPNLLMYICMFYPQAKATSPGQIKETKYISNSERSDCDHYRVRDAIS